MLDGAAPFYRCYQTQIGRYIATGAIEPKFYVAMCKALNLMDPIFADQMNRKNWPTMCKGVAAAIKGMDLDILQRAVDTPDACLSWVVPLGDVGKFGYMKAGQTILRDNGLTTVSAAPRFTPVE
ncbi:CoA transferase [Pseudophaeobacter sp.]|uniref:CoA transferase n=1 Tax=Pseudophaeobacter sp. TaxID=1971739 RepID=UPI003297257C